MGDILHAFPAAESLRLSFPGAAISWVTRARWLPLLKGAPFLDRVIALEGLASWKAIRALRPDVAFDFQGLFQSALVGRAARPRTFWGFDRSIVRESLAALLYSNRVAAHGPHRIQRNLQLIEKAGAQNLTDKSWIAQGSAEGELPVEPFVLASPFAGWAGKQWPLESYAALAGQLAGEGLRLVLNLSREQARSVRDAAGVHIHISGLPGLIHATRNAAAVVGVDSGPLHLAAALNKPGVAIYGPTDPAATGPFGGSMIVLRTEAAETTYDRHREIHSSMRAVTPAAVAEAVLQSVGARLRSR